MRGRSLVVVAAVALAGCGSAAHTVTVTSPSSAAGAASGAGAPPAGTNHASTGAGAPPAGTNHASTGADAHPSSASGAAVAASAPSPARFGAAADAICRSYRATVGSAGRATTLVAQEHVFSAVVGNAERAVGRLRALPAPAADATEFGRFISLTTVAIREFVAAQSRSRSTRESSGVTTESQDFAAFQRAGRAAIAAGAAARRLGLRVCGAAGSDWL